MKTFLVQVDSEFIPWLGLPIRILSDLEVLVEVLG